MNKLVSTLLITTLAGLAGLAGLALAPSPARAATGVCDVDPGDNGPSELACIAAIQALGNNAVVADIFKDANGKTGDQLLYGQLVDPWGGCAEANTICNGDLSSSQGTPAVICLNSSHDFNTTAAFVDALDWKYANPVRMLNAHGYHGGANNMACPNWNESVGDGNKEGYLPWEGMVFDLGGPSNKVVLFPVNDHGPQPCESTEYTVYLTDNPLSRDLIADPTITGADPQKWNRAKLSTIFLEGWKKVRPGNDPGLNYTIEADSFTSVWSLPCGINFRYVGIIAGNDGNQTGLSACNFDSFDAEIDAVAGLTEGGAGVCPDADGDKYVDCMCPTAPPICDCNDADPKVHPGAPEPCDSPDLNCDNIPGSCAQVGTVCYQSICIPTCGGENPLCPVGSSCSQTPQGSLCVPQDCKNSGCPAGGVCNMNGICVPACTAVQCPGNDICQDGQCIDPCQGVQCPGVETCVNGVCTPPCNCFAGDIGCASDPGTVCDKGGSNVCVPPMCAGKSCPPGQVCDPNTGVCVDFCNMNVMCPVGQKCLSPDGCVPLCTGVMCPMGFDCNPQNGMCEDTSCVNVSCFPPLVCVMGQCVDQGSGGAGGSMTAASTSAASSSSGGDMGGAGGQDPGDKGSCGCRAVGAGDGEIPLSLLLAAAGLAAFTRRRR